MELNQNGHRRSKRQTFIIFDPSAIQSPRNQGQLPGDQLNRIDFKRFRLSATCQQARFGVDAGLQIRARPSVRAFRNRLTLNSARISLHIVLPSSCILPLPHSPYPSVRRYVTTAWETNAIDKRRSAKELIVPFSPLRNGLSYLRIENVPGPLTLWCKEPLLPPWTLTIACRLAGVLVDLVIVRPDELSGSDTSALSENPVRNFH